MKRLCNCTEDSTRGKCGHQSACPLCECSHPNFAPVKKNEEFRAVEDYDDFDDDDRSCVCGAIGCDECDADYYENFDCGMMRDGLCTKAGSEECDWECPFN